MAVLDNVERGVNHDRCKYNAASVELCIARTLVCGHTIWQVRSLDVATLDYMCFSSTVLSISKMSISHAISSTDNSLHFALGSSIVSIV